MVLFAVTTIGALHVFLHLGVSSPFGVALIDTRDLSYLWKLLLYCQLAFMPIKYLKPLLEENHVGVCPCQKTSFWSNWLITGEQNVAHLSLFIFNTSNEARNREQRRLKVKDIHMAGGWIGAEVSSLPHIASVVRSIIDTPAFSAQWL